MFRETATQYKFRYETTETYITISKLMSDSEDLKKCMEKYRNWLCPSNVVLNPKFCFELLIFKDLCAEIFKIMKILKPQIRFKILSPEIFKSKPELKQDIVIKFNHKKINNSEPGFTWIHPYKFSKSKFVKFLDVYGQCLIDLIIEILASREIRGSLAESLLFHAGVDPSKFREIE